MILWSVKKETDIRRGRHCVFLMHVHLVFVTKYRRQIFDYDATEKLRTYFSNVCADFEAELVEMDGEPDHVHLLINYPPKLAISSLVNSLKGVSGRLLRRDRPDIAARYYYKAFCGVLAILPVAAVVHQYPSSANTLNNSKHLVRWKTAPYIPALNERGFTAHRIKQSSFLGR
ncbi:transposase [Escherichia coli O169:H41 str. F9792]|nr:transposase [Escherichia coli O169:H41 str. F9792]